MTSDIALQLLWVAAHHGLRQHGARGTMPRPTQIDCWGDVHRITTALGNPPAPGGPR